MNIPDSSCVVSRHHATVLGHPDASRTVVLSHGLGSDQTVWQHILPRFDTATPEGWRVVLYDHVGAGRSDPAAFLQHRYLSLSAYVDDLVELCDALQLRAAVGIGHSMGAMIIALASLRRPEHFSRLVLIGASPCYREDGDYHGGLTHRALNDVYSAMRHDRDRWAAHFAPRMLGPDSRPLQVQAFARALAAIPEERLLTVACAVFQSDHRADIGRIAHPTLIVQSQDDPVVTQSVADYLHAHIPGSTLVGIAASGHLPHLTAPGAVWAAIEPFLDTA